MTAPPLSPGSLFDGRYQLEERVDDFGVGESWRGRDRADGADVIVKLLPPFGPAERAAGERFHDLARSLAATRHRGVLATRRHGVAQGVPYLVHDFFAGVSLARAFALARTGRHLLAPGALANLLDRACEAVAAAHAATPPLIHGGLMPGSLVAAMIAGRFDVRVIDFGLARVFGERLKVARATEYMAPLVEDDPASAGVTDDVFALGSIVMEAVTDRREAQGLGAGTVGNLSAVAKRRHDVPAALMAIATRATRIDARQRHPDVSALREALAAAWSPDARPAPDDAPAELPAGIAGVAASYTSWVRFSDTDEAAPVAPIAPVAPVAPIAPVAPPPIAPPQVAFVAPPADLSTTQVARGPADELLGATTRLPSKGAPAADLGATLVAAPHAAPPAPAMPATQLLAQFDAPAAPPPYAPPAPHALYVPPTPYAAPQRVYGAAPSPAQQPPATQPAASARGPWIAVGVAALLLAAAALVWLVTHA